MANCSICGKKIRWWQGAAFVTYRKIQRVDKDGVIAVVPVPDSGVKLHHHRKCWPGFAPVTIDTTGRIIDSCLTPRQRCRREP